MHPFALQGYKVERLKLISHKFGILEVACALQLSLFVQFKYMLQFFHGISMYFLCPSEIVNKYYTILYSIINIIWKTAM